MLQVNNIEVVYMSVIQVLRGVSLEVGENKIITLLGANGAGKTTTLKAVSGMLRTEEGEVSDGSIDFDGKRIDRYGPEEISNLAHRSYNYCFAFPPFIHQNNSFIYLFQ